MWPRVPAQCAFAVIYSERLEIVPFMHHCMHARGCSVCSRGILGAQDAQTTETVPDRLQTSYLDFRRNPGDLIGAYQAIAPPSSPCCLLRSHA